MVGLSGPFILQRFFTIKPVKRFITAWWEEDFFRILTIIASVTILAFVSIMWVIEANGNANCEKHYGPSYSYDVHASGDNAATKCVNDETKERKPVVVEKSE